MFPINFGSLQTPPLLLKQNNIILFPPSQFLVQDFARNLSDYLIIFVITKGGLHNYDK